MSATTWVSCAAALGSGLVGGVFFAFSGFVMPALRTLPTADAVRAMQAINRTATQPPLMIALFGTAAVCAIATVPAIRNLTTPAAPWTLAAAVTYLASGVVVTIVANVPRNESLATLDPTSSAAAAAWQQFATEWTTWNHVRTVGCLASCVLFCVGLTRPVR